MEGILEDRYVRSGSEDPEIRVERQLAMNDRDVDWVLQEDAIPVVEERRVLDPNVLRVPETDPVVVRIAVARIRVIPPGVDVDVPDDDESGRVADQDPIRLRCVDLPATDHVRVGRVSRSSHHSVRGGKGRVHFDSDLAMVR